MYPQWLEKTTTTVGQYGAENGTQNIPYTDQ